MELLQTTTLAGQTIVNPLLVATYTADDIRELLVNVGLSGIGGNNVYRACMTRQRLGAGTFYQSPTSAAAVAATVTTLWLPSLSLAVDDTDVVRVYVQGIAGDVNVGIVTEIFDVTPTGPDDLCDVWACSRRTLTMPITSIKSMLLGTKLELLRGDTFDQDFIRLGDLNAATELWFTVKQALSDADSIAEIQISLTNGLEAIAGAAAGVPANGSITITDLALGNITVELAAVETAKLDVDFVGYWDIQKAEGDVITTITRGNCQVIGDATRSTS